MRPAHATFLVVALALASALPAVAQEHAHEGAEGTAFVLHDGPADGRAVVGAYTHLGFALLDKEGAPVVHRDAAFHVLQGTDVLFSTTDAHEYDGLFSLDLRFTRPGPYQVLATSEGMLLGTFEGEAVLPSERANATVELSVTPQGPASRLVDVEIAIVDDQGALIPHTDAILEWRAARDGAFAGRTHLHIHDEPIRLTQALGLETEYVAEVVAYKAFATGRSPDVVAVTARTPVSAGPVAAPALPAPEATLPTLLTQVGGKASADGLTLHHMLDPNQQVGLGQPVRLVGLVTEDVNASPLAHVDFALTLSGPRGLVFSSASGHEYDGVFEHVFVPDAPGLYDGLLTATYDAVELSVPVRVQVAPPAVPLLGSTGVMSVALMDAPEPVAGVPANLTFAVMGSAGPGAHSEVDVTIFHETECAARATDGRACTEPPTHQFKLHTHDSGLTSALVTFPHEGRWTIRVDPLPTTLDAALFPPASFVLDVAASAPAEEAGAVDAAAAKAVPGAGVALVALVAVAVALARRG